MATDLRGSFKTVVCLRVWAQTRPKQYVFIGILRRCHVRTAGHGHPVENLFLGRRRASWADGAQQKSRVRSKRPSKPYEFIGLGAMSVIKPFKFVWFGDIRGRKPFEFIGWRWSCIYLWLSNSMPSWDSELYQLAEPEPPQSWPRMVGKLVFLVTGLTVRT